MKLLKQLAEKLKSEKRTKEDAIKTLQSAKILDENKEFTKPFENLNKMFKC
jgi:hypothetical protein